MAHPVQYVLAQTEIEERDGGTWVSGLCPYCWERLAYLAPPEGTAITVQCPNGHSLRIVDQRSAGRHPDQQARVRADR
jgi:hypothetical protein